MLLLDTNVLSAIMGVRPVPEVAAWMAGKPIERISQAEILSGLAIMPERRPRWIR